MTVKLWELEIYSDEYEALSPEQQEFADFLWKMDYEGGVESLLGHSGDRYFPESLKPLARVIDHHLSELQVKIRELKTELDIEY